MSKQKSSIQYLNLPAVFLLSAVMVGLPAASAQGRQGETTIAKATPPDTPIQGRVVEDIVAWVNDQIITQSDYDRALQQLEAEGRQQDIPPQEMEERKSNLLRDLIDQQLLLSKGKELNITGETELIHQLDQIRKQNHLNSLEDLEKAAQQQGVSYEDFKANIRNNIITQQVVRDQVHVSMTQSEAEAYFKAHESEFAQPESVRLKEILIPTPPNPATGTVDEAELQAARTKAEEVESKLKAGAKFDDLAKTYSGGPNAAQGGDLGEFRRGMMAKELDDQTFSLQAGQATKPIRTKQGYIILQVAEHTPGGEASFKQVEPRVEEALYMERMQPALRQYLTKLREDGYVDLKPGVIDSGASPNEIRAVTSAYTPPAPKKKKKFARKRFRGVDRSRQGQAVAKTSAPGIGAGAAAPATATPAATPVAKTATTAVATAKNAKVQKPGKREKVRFGRAPREALPPAQSPTPAADTTTTAESVAPEVTQQPASAVNDVNYVNPDGSISTPGATDAVAKKSRFSDRAKIRKAKNAKAAGDGSQAAPPTAEELASQQVQSAPLGLNPPPAKKKKEKKKGEKTRYADRQPEPEVESQPYMGNSAQQPAQAPAGQQQPAQTPAPAPSSTQP